MSLVLAVPYYVWIIVSALLTATGELLSKEFGNTHRAAFLIAAFVVYSLGTLAWFPSIYEKNQLSIVGVMWSVLSLTTTVIIGVLIFGEKLNLMSTIGILFAFVAIAFLSLA